MFKRPASAATPASKSAAPDYAFTASAAHSSSAQARQQELDSFHTPLPAPGNTRQPAAYTNPFADQTPRQYQSRSPSPNATRPLLPGASPLGHSPAPGADLSGNMPSRNYPSRAGGAMPPRGESQNALLADAGRVSVVPSVQLLFLQRQSPPIALP